MKDDDSYLIDGILPKREPSLLAGPSGAGKTTWLFDTLLAFERGEPILGFDSHSAPWIYVAADRSIEAMYRTLDRMHIPRNSFPVLPAWDERLTIQGIMSEVKSGGFKLAVIEGFGQFVDPPGHTQQVRNFLRSICEICKSDDTTIWGIVESPKMKPRDAYDNPRQRVSGPAAWSHHTETIFLMEYADPKHPDNDERTLTVCPRNCTGLVVPYRFVGGHLIVKKAKVDKKLVLLSHLDS